MKTMVNDQFNKTRVVLHASGKYGLESLDETGAVVEESGPRYRTLEMATSAAQDMSDENDRIDAYENAHR